MARCRNSCVPILNKHVLAGGGGWAGPPLEERFPYLSHSRDGFYFNNDIIFVLCG